MRTNGRRFARSFADEEVADAPEDAEPGVLDEPVAPEEPDYKFEGFSVEFLDKVALLPVTPVSKPPTPGAR